MRSPQSLLLPNLPTNATVETPKDLWPSPESPDSVIGFLAYLFALTTLPHSDRASSATEPYIKHGPGGVTVCLSSAHGRRLPYGRYPRLFLADVCTAAVRNKSPIVELGPTLEEYCISRWKVIPVTGKKGTVAAIKQQLLRCKDLVVSYEQNLGTASTKSTTFALFSHAEFWWEQCSGTPSRVQISAELYRILVDRPIPLRFDILRATRSPAQMDLVIFLSWVGYVSNGSPFHISFSDLERRFGATYTESRNFKTKFLQSLTAVVVDHYPDTRVEKTRDGITLRQVRSLVPPASASPARR